MLKIVKMAALLFLYGFDVLLLGLVEKLVNGLIKKLTALSGATGATIARINEKRAALKQSDNA